MFTVSPEWFRSPQAIERQRDAKAILQMVTATIDRAVADHDASVSRRAGNRACP
jgi:hypothetical protein